MTQPILRPLPGTASQKPLHRRLFGGIRRGFAATAHSLRVGQARVVGRYLDSFLGSGGDGGGVYGGLSIAALGAELHRLRRTREPVTVVTRGGYVYQTMRVEAVHRHHTRLASATYPEMLLPLAFIQSAHPIHQARHQEHAHAR